MLITIQRKRKMTEYLVTWKEFPQGDAQWVQSSHITKEAVEDQLNYSYIA